MTQVAGAPLAARELPALFARVHTALAERRERIDDLNVFPVPDGDTGTNMTLTVRAGVEALRAAQRERRIRDVEELARSVVRGTVGGARGNSGVILSQVIRAVVEVVTGHRHVDARLYAEALTRARGLAYEAVAEPVEGTILTAIHEAARAATAAAEAGGDLRATSAATCAATARAVERTREQLDVLRRAGVVDAGARGFEVVLAAVHGHLTGRTPEVTVDPPRSPDASEPRSSGEPYEVQYLLDAGDEVAGPLRARLERLGDSAVVVGAGGLLNVHVHTARVGEAIEAGVAFGPPSAIRVVDLGRAGRAARRAPTDVADHLGVVAVLRGDGARAIAGELGAVVVEGGAGALPSVAELVGAAAGQARVVLLPGHRDGVAAAEQAVRELSSQGCPATLIAEAATPPAVLAALSVFDPRGVPDEVVRAMRSAAGALRAGEVVAATRTASTSAGRVRAGQPLAVVAGEVVGTAVDPLDALAEVCRALDAGGAELVMLLHGRAASRSECEAATELVRRLAPHAELEVIDADVSPARFWVGVE